MVSPFSCPGPCVSIVRCSIFSIYPWVKSMNRDSKSFKNLSKSCPLSESLDPESFSVRDWPWSFMSASINQNLQKQPISTPYNLPPGSTIIVSMSTDNLHLLDYQVNRNLNCFCRRSFYRDLRSQGRSNVGIASFSLSFLRASRPRASESSSIKSWAPLT